MDFNKLLTGLSGWPAAAVLIVVIICVTAVLIAFFGPWE